MIEKVYSYSCNPPRTTHTHTVERNNDFVAFSKVMNVSGALHTINLDGMTLRLLFSYL